ncbi:MAG: hypothetical protein KKH52_00170 [Nanoarchaeota archaeon]|nr:hypothetical protein [Nanoarchaeota archaeon]
MSLTDIVTQESGFFNKVGNKIKQVGKNLAYVTSVAVLAFSTYVCGDEPTDEVCRGDRVWDGDECVEPSNNNGYDAGDETPDSSASSLEIIGTYIDHESDVLHTITEETWTYGFSGGDHLEIFEILSYSNEIDHLIARNNDNNMYYRSLNSRFDWIQSDSTLWFCRSNPNAETPEDAQNTSRPDANDPANGGCRGFPWVPLTPN